MYNAYLNIAQQCEFLFYGRSTLTHRVWRAITKSRIFSVKFSRHFPAQFGGVLSHSLPIYDFFSDIKSVQYLVIIFTWHICRGVQPVSLDCSMAHHSSLRQQFLDFLSTLNVQYSAFTFEFFQYKMNIQLLINGILSFSEIL